MRTRGGEWGGGPRINTGSGDFDGHRLDDYRLVGHEEREAAGVLGLERRGHVLQRADRDDDRGIGALVAQVRPVHGGDPLRGHALGGYFGPCVLLERARGAGQPVQAGLGQRHLDGLLAHGDDIG
jgi:hypothetical protein